MVYALGGRASSAQEVTDSMLKSELVSNISKESSNFPADSKIAKIFD